MPKAPPPLQLRPIIQKTFAFVRSQPVLYPIAFWLIAVPGFFLTILDQMIPAGAPPADAPFPVLASTPFALTAGIAAILLMVLFVFWGYGSILLLGKRLVMPKQGRSRSSFRAVRRESLHLVLPLIFTNILRNIFILYRALPYLLPTFFFAIGMSECRGPFAIALETLRSCSALWLLSPLLMPAAIYCIRTVVADMAVVGEELAPRGALKRSKELVKGRSWQILWIFVALNILFFGPPFILGWLIHFFLIPIDWRLILLSAAITNLLIAAGTIFYLPSMMILFSALRGTRETR